ncbi:hypothetical protein [Methylobacterium gnaphalii]|uniref:hypothetical protein n=1 Tax=Methylobacterium gnaphalii TaxID=1010610 RepID=UPI0011BE539D|nr:hypothetical protein [Methylobacterium gnaphalii]
MAMRAMEHEASKHPQLRHFMRQPRVHHDMAKIMLARSGIENSKNQPQTLSGRKTAQMMAS